MELLVAIAFYLLRLVRPFLFSVACYFSIQFISDAWHFNLTYQQILSIIVGGWMVWCWWTFEGE